MGNLAYIVQGQGRFGQGEKLAREVIEAGTRRLGPESAQVLRCDEQPGRGALEPGPLCRGGTRVSPLVDVDRRVLGPDHPEL